VASVPKHFVARNKRKLDMSVARFENDTDKKVDRTNWGLPVPNKEAAYLSLAKYAKDIPAMDTKQVVAMNAAFQWMERHFGPYMMGSRVKSQQEVVDGLDMTTSPGFPWTRKYATKRAMYDDWKDFSKYMEDDWERLRFDEYAAVFGNSLKEEIRPQEKIVANSIRTFTAGPIEMTIHGNRLFEDMNQRFYAAHLKTASVVGFSPLKGGWDQLVRKLRRHPNGFALDESQYDSSLRAYLMWACAAYRWRMLRQEDQTPVNLERLQVYYRNLVNTLILTSDGVFVMKKGGNPSGSVNTISDNTLILFILLAYGWIQLVPEEYLDLASFEEHVSLAICGDDNTWTVSNVMLPYFNARALIKEWARIGIVTTTDSLEPRPVEELDFLSAYTVYIDGVAVPLYSREKMLTSLLYSREPDNPSYALIRACAILRVTWADAHMRNYLKEYIAWLVSEYGEVLHSSEEWKQALHQIPTEHELKCLFLGPREGVMIHQGYRKQERLESGIKKVRNVMETIALPQRVKRNRRQGRGGATRKGKQTKALVVRVPRRVRPQKQRVRKRKARGARRGPSSFGQWPVGNQPRSKRGCTVQEDEFVTDLNGSVGYAVTQYAINPGQATTFPWLSKEASQWEKYHFEKLEFYYKPEVSQFATNGQSGKVIFMIDYDAADAPPADKQHAEDADPHVDGMPYQSFSLSADPREMFQRSDAKYVRPGGLPGSSDIKTYDAGNLFVSTVGNANTSLVGELHVRYIVHFSVPILENIVGAPMNNSVFWSSGTVTNSIASATATNLLFNPTITNGLGVLTTANPFLTIPPGNYLYDIIVDVGLASSSAGNGISFFRINPLLDGVTTGDIIPTMNNTALLTNITTFSMSTGGFIAVPASGQELVVVGTVTFGSGTCVYQMSIRLVAI